MGSEMCIRDRIMIDIDSTKRSLADAQRRVKELGAQHQPSDSDEGQIAALEKQIAKAQKEIAKLNDEKSGVEEEIQTLQSTIMEVGGVRLRGQKAKVDGLKEQIGMLAEEISNAEGQQSKNEKLIKKHTKARDVSENEIAQITDELEKLEEDVANQTNESADWRQKADEAQEVTYPRSSSILNLHADHP